MTPYIYTRSGDRLNPLDPDPKLVDVNDLAHSLALCNRFAGHTAEPISVAQHSVYVARLVQSWRIAAGAALGSPVAQVQAQPWAVLQALLHDAAEAYLG